VLPDDYKQKVERRQKLPSAYKQKPKRKLKYVFKLLLALITAASVLGGAVISSGAAIKSDDDNSSPADDNAESANENKDNVILSHEQNIEAQNLKQAAFGLTKQIYHKENNDEKLNLLEIVYNILKELLKEYQSDDDTETIYAITEAINYEILGDQHSLDDDRFNSSLYYRQAIDELLKTAENKNFTIEDEEENLSRLKRKISNNLLVSEFFTKFSLETRDSSNDNYLYMLEKISKNYFDFGSYRQAALWYYTLTKQKVTGSRKERNYDSFVLACEKWEFADNGDFINCIHTGVAGFIVKENNVKLMQEPLLSHANLIRELTFHEEGRVLQRSDNKQKIGKTEAYWYQVITSDNTIGWIHGQYLLFYPVYIE
jgi:hypothetical protein